MLYKRVEPLLSIYKQGGKMQEKRYKLTEKGRKILEERKKEEESINMQDFAGYLLGYMPKDNNKE
jgi:predicted transcriptional regulator